jgi:branched-chain amino acid transport system substrate-binding protein
MLRRMLAAFVAVIAGAALTLGAAHAQNPIRIGIIGPMAFVQGENHWAGAQVAADQINKAGGIKVGNTQRPIQLFRVDSNEIVSVPDATNAMERTLTRDKVDFVVGGFRTEAVLAMQDVAMDYKKVFLGVGAAHDELGARVEKDYDRYKYWFRVAPIKSSDLGKSLFGVLATIGAQIRSDIGKETPKVAILAEKAVWVEGIVKAAQATLPKMKMEVVGVWQPSPIASDVTAELSAIRRAGADMIFTALSGPVGIVLGRQMGELKIPAIPFGINVEAQKDGFWQATGGMGNYVATLDTYGDGVAVTPNTLAFTKAFKERFNNNPTYTAAVYDAINLIKDAVEAAGTIDADKVVAVLEKTDTVGTAGRLVFDKRHDPIFGPGYVTGLAVQWQDGKKVAFWPRNWNGVTYKGVEEFRIPKHMLAQKN